MIFDISFNAADEMYNGFYNNSKKHDPDLDIVMQRSFKNNILPFFVGKNYETSKKCLQLANKYNTFCYLGLHPNNATENKEDIDKIINLINEQKNIEKPNNFRNKNTFIAVGECGLDFYRNFANKNDQKEIFTKLLDLNEKCYFIHSRNSHRELLEIIDDYKLKGVVHSFDGTIEEARDLIKKGLFIGINGHSLKENLHYIKEIDISKILIESDAPYCGIGKTYEGYKYIKTYFEETKKYNSDKIFKRRNEPCKTIQIMEVLSSLYDIEIEELEKILFDNTIQCFGL
ncbi:TatD DNase [Gurleya vavrai]